MFTESTNANSINTSSNNGIPHQQSIKPAVSYLKK